MRIFKLIFLLIMLVMIYGCKDNSGTIANKEKGNIPVTVDNNAMNQGKEVKKQKENNEEGRGRYKY